MGFIDISIRHLKIRTREVSSLLYDNISTMWYKKANLFKEATSLGMYIESIAKKVGNLAIISLKKEISEEYQTTYTCSASIEEAIGLTNIPESIKRNLIKSFKNLKAISVNLFASNMTFDGKGIRKIILRGGSLRIVGNAKIININIDYNYIQIGSSKELISVLQDIYTAIVPTIRHELEHYIQSSGMGAREEFGKNQKSVYDFKNYRQHTESAISYYEQPEEVEAFVSSLYMKAKNSRIPFSQVLRNFTTNQVLPGLYMEFDKKHKKEYDSITLSKLSREEATNGSNKIYNLYMDYAKKRYPNIGKENNLT